MILFTGILAFYAIDSLVSKEWADEWVVPTGIPPAQTFRTNIIQYIYGYHRELSYMNYICAYQFVRVPTHGGVGTTARLKFCCCNCQFELLY